MTTVELRACPFCGGKAEMRHSETPREYATRIKCAVCGTEKFGYNYFAKASAQADAIAAWNRRPSAPAGVTEGVTTLLDAEGYMWPARLSIRDTKLHDDMGGRGQRIYTTAGHGYTTVDYVRAVLAAPLPNPEADQLREALERVLRSLSYPVDTSIRADGYDIKHDPDTVLFAVQTLRAALTKEPANV